MKQIVVALIFALIITQAVGCGGKKKRIQAQIDEIEEAQPKVEARLEEIKNWWNENRPFTESDFGMPKLKKDNYVVFDKNAINTRYSSPFRPSGLRNFLDLKGQSSIGPFFEGDDRTSEKIRECMDQINAKFLVLVENEILVEPKLIFKNAPKNKLGIHFPDESPESFTPGSMSVQVVVVDTEDMSVQWASKKTIVENSNWISFTEKRSRKTNELKRNNAGSALDIELTEQAGAEACKIIIKLIPTDSERWKRLQKGFEESDIAY